MFGTYKWIEKNINGGIDWICGKQLQEQLKLFVSNGKQKETIW